MMANSGANFKNICNQMFFHTSNFCIPVYVYNHRQHTHAHTHTPINIERSDNLGKCEVLSDGTGYSDLVNAQVGVGSDDSAGREIHPLPHEIASHSSFFALQSLLD